MDPFGDSVQKRVEANESLLWALSLSGGSFRLLSVFAEVIIDTENCESACVGSTCR